MTLPAGLCGFLGVWLWLWGPEAWAQAAAPPVREVKVRRVELPQLASGEVPEVRVTPGYLTVLEFDAPLSREAVTVEGLESRLALFEVNERTVVLRPTVELASAERLLLTVRFADGLAPASAVLALVAHPSEVDGQLQVVRRPLSNEALQARMQAVLARCEAGGLAQAVLSGAVGKDGVTVEQLEGRGRWKGVKDVSWLRSKAYRSWKRLVATMLLHLPAGDPPWIPGEALLLDATGKVVQRSPVWLDAGRLNAGESGVIAVEFERHPEGKGHRFSLEVREKDGERGVVIEGVEL